MNTYRFHWTSSYRHEVDYTVNGPDGTSRLSLQHDDPVTDFEYDRQTYNGTAAEFDRDVIGKIGILAPYMATDGPVSIECLEAFNAWRQAEHKKHKAEMLARPDRYGITDPDDPIFKPPVPAVRGFYKIGTGWIRPDEEAQRGLFETL